MYWAWLSAEILIYTVRMSSFIPAFDRIVLASICICRPCATRWSPAVWNSASPPRRRSPDWDSTCTRTSFVCRAWWAWAHRRSRRDVWVCSRLSPARRPLFRIWLQFRFRSARCRRWSRAWLWPAPCILLWCARARSRSCRLWRLSDDTYKHQIEIQL